LEHIQDYINIEHKLKSTIGRIPPAFWPTSGKVKVENLSARYSADGPIVLHDISFHIKSGEYVGISKTTFLMFNVYHAHSLFQWDAPEVEKC
jgi:ABC-type multidrug transport system fused ATPase/permease subunit